MGFVSLGRVLNLGCDFGIDVSREGVGIAGWRRRVGRLIGA